MHNQRQTLIQCFLLTGAPNILYKKRKNPRDIRHRGSLQSAWTNCGVNVVNSKKNYTYHAHICLQHANMHTTILKITSHMCIDWTKSFKYTKVYLVNSRMKIVGLLTRPNTMSKSTNEKNRTSKCQT